MQFEAVWTLVTLVPLTQTMARLSSCETHLFSPPLRWVYPRIRTGLLVLHGSLSSSLTNTVLLFLLFVISQGLDNKKCWQGQRQIEDGLDLYYILCVNLLFSAVCISLPLCPLALCQCLITVLCLCDLLPVLPSSWFPLSLLNTMLRFLSLASVFLVVLCLFPLGSVVRAL